MLESKFKTKLKKEIEARFPGSMVFHLDPGDLQGIPDLIVLHENKWFALEGKKTEKASHRPNQDYYVDLMNEMSGAAFVYPENKNEVLNSMSEYFTGGAL